MRAAFLFWRWGRLAIAAAAALLIGWNIYHAMADGAGRITRQAMSVVDIDANGGLILRMETGRTQAIGLLGIRPRPGHEAEYGAEIRRRSMGGKIRVTVPVDLAAATPVKGYIYLGDGVMLNEWLVMTGLAAADGSHHPLGDWFTRQERKAAWRPAKLPVTK